MNTVTAFADEISPDLETQLQVLTSEGIKHLELRGVWGKNVLKLTDDEVYRVKAELERRGFRVSAVGSPIGKISIVDDFAQHMVDFARTLFVAKVFDTPYIRIFSFFIPEGDDPAQYRDEVLRRMKALVRQAEIEGIVLLHENEKHIYGDTPERCLDLLEACASRHLRCAFDPANFVQCGVRPYTEAYPLLAEHIEYMHIKDARFAGGTVTPAGEGDGDVAKVLQALKQSGYGGFLSLEPHLSAAGTFSGFSGPELFKVAADALKRLLRNMGEAWN